MKKPVLTIFRWLLALMGFGTIAGCGEIINDQPCEYGMPLMDYVVSGKVTDKAGKPIKGIEVGDNHYGSPKDTTGADGLFSISSSEFPCDSLTLIAKDIDGTENGSYADKSQSVALTKIKKGDGKWYEGSFEAKDVIIKMTEK